MRRPTLTERGGPAARERAAAVAALLSAVFPLFTGCGTAAPPPPAPQEGDGRPYLVSGLDAGAEQWVDDTLGRLSLAEAAGQLVFPWISGGYAAADDPEFLETVEWVERWGIGGVVISIGTPHAYVAKLNRLQEHAAVPLLVTSDFENGGPAMRINHSYALPSLLGQGGGTSFPPTMAFGAVGAEAEVERFARITALEARAVGVHMNFAPVLDVNSNPDNPIINTRSFGESPTEVATLGRAYIRGARAGGVLTTAKHFPGHGDTEVDSHLELPAIRADRERLDRVELLPFRAAIEEGVDAVMTAHIALPGLLGEGTPPATLAPEIMTGLLREELGFTGLLVTDALRMGAITAEYGAGEAAVLALEAGSDVILIPASVPSAVEAIVGAVEEGRVPRERLDRSVRRILQAKARVGLEREATLPIEGVSARVGTDAHREAAREAAARSITLVRDRGGLVPLDPDRHRRILSVTYAPATNLVAGREFNGILSRLVGQLRTSRVGPDTPDAEWTSLLRRAADFDAVLVGAYIAPQAGAGSVALPDPVADFITALAVESSVVLISLGNPYLLSAAPSVGSYLLAWGGREVSQRAAARAVAGAEPIGGRLPVTIPGLHELGEGIMRAAIPAIAARGEPRRDLLDEAGLVREGGGERPAEADPDTVPGEVGLVLPPPLPPGRPAPGSWRGLGVSPLEADPALVGMDAGALGELDAYIEAALADSVAPGAALAVGRRGRLVRLRGYGRLDWDPSSAAVTPYSLYDLASLTKVVGTTTAIMMLAGEGAIDLDAPVVRYLPEFASGDGRKAAITIRDLLLHRGGLPPFIRYFEDLTGLEPIRRAAFATPLETAPREEMVYSDIGFMTLGWTVEAAGGRPLDAFLEERLFDRLGMADTGFNPDPAEWVRTAPTEVDGAYRGRHVVGEVHDENAWAMGGVSGHAGLFSTAADLAVFVGLLAGGGMLETCAFEAGSGLPCGARSVDVRRRILGEEAVGSFTVRAFPASSRALGWDTPSPGSSAGDFFSARSFGHTGFTGTSIWVDPENELFVILLTNRVNPTRENARIFEFRPRVHDLAIAAISDREVPLRDGG